MADTEDGWRVEDVLAQSAWIRRLAGRLVADAAHRDDVVQDAWIEALQHGQSARALRPWLAGVLRNLVRMDRRGDMRRRSKEGVEEAAASPATPEQLVERVEIEREVAAALLEIDEPYRSTLLWRFYDDLSAAEIARRSGVPAGTVRWRLKEGLDLLRVKLDARFNGDRRRWSVALIPTAAAARGGLTGGLAIVGGALIMKATTKAIVALVILLLLAFGGIQLWRHHSSVSEVTRAQPGAAWRMPGGIGGTNAAPTVAGVAVPSWFGQRGAPIRRIAGRVTFAGEPVVGASVELASDLTDAGLMAVAKRQTAADGRFDFGTQPPAKFSVAASAPQHGPAIVEVDTRNPTSVTDNLELRLGGCESAVFGHVNDSSRGPIAGAQVCLAPPRATACVTADASGAYNICLSPMQLFVTVKASGYGAIYDRVEFKGRRVKRDYFLTPEATIVGRVVRADTNAPVPGASVRVQPIQWTQRFSAPVATTTDAQGKFTLGGLAPGRQHVIAFAEGLAAAEAVDINVEAGRSSGDVLLRLRLASRVSGVVTDGHDPIVGATVSLDASEMAGLVDAVTQSDGSFVIEPVARGRTPISVSEYEVQEPKIVTIDRAEVTVRVLVNSMGSIAGHVYADGKPLPGANVTFGFVQDSAFAEADGGYIVRGLRPGPYRVYGGNLATGAFGFAPEFVLGKNEHRTGVDIDVKYNGAISGVVVEPDGKPLPGVNVFYAALHENDVGSDVTAPDGTFRVTNLLGSDDYRGQVRINARNPTPLRLVEGEGQLVHVKDGAAEVSGVRLVVQRDHLAISGSTVDGDGNPMTDVRVVAFRSEGENAVLSDFMDHPSAVSDVDGKFSIADLDAGSFALQAHAGDGSEAIVRGIAAGQKNVVIKLQRAGGIDGTLVGFSSEPAVKAIRDLGAMPTFVFATVNGISFRLRGLNPGTYQVAAVGAEADAQKVDVAAGQIATVTLKSRGSTTIRGRVVDWASGAPMAGVRCMPGLQTSADAQPMWITSNGSFSDEAGAFQLDDAPGGAVSVYCDNQPYTYTNGRADFTATAGQTATCEIPVVKIIRDKPQSSFGAMIQPGIMPARIMIVTPGGPADRAGVRVGDVVTTVDGANVMKLTPMGVMFVIGQRPVGSTMHLGLTRGNQTVTADVVMVAP
jgi:RNA polymerase sigma factor (sigma-70 family)